MSKEKYFFGTSIINNMLIGGAKEAASPPQEVFFKIPLLTL